DYAAGGAQSPIIFSAGSLTGPLAGALGSRARNQFYLVTIPMSLIPVYGIVGTVRAWDWAYGLGWREATSAGSGIPDQCGFGLRDSLQKLAGEIAAVVDSPFSEWAEIETKLPRIKYLLHKDVITLSRI